MKTKRFCKSTVSLILAVMMLVSMLTVGIVNASAAETDLTGTGAMDYTNCYLEGSFNNWDQSTDQFDSDGNLTLDIAAGNYSFKVRNRSTYKQYSSGSSITDSTSSWNLYETNGQMCGFIATGGSYTFTITENGNQLGLVIKYNGSSGGGTTDPTEEETTPTEEPTTPSGDPTSLTKLYFMDNSPDQFMDNFDADIYASFDSGKKQQMKQRVDTMSGKTLWSIDIPDGATNVKFYRYSKLDTLWGEWSTVSLSGKTSGYYKAVSGSGSWETDESTFSPSSDEDITNFWYGVWVDSKGNGNAYDSVRWWKDSSGYYHIFLPAHTPSTFKLYTSFDSFTVNSKTVTRGNYIEMSNVSFSSYYSMSYVKSGTTTAGRVYFHKTVNPANSDYGVSTLLLTTDDQFWTETTDDYLSDVSGYKDAIETKGSIYLYDKDGNLVNSGSGETKLKKIKGRGNSSFQASMDLYGKYAYNFNLDKNVSLIDGATKTKKWCLLANNVDHSMLRNTFAYSLAADLGLDFSPKTRPVDVYDNGEYIGSYTIIEKVEYGEKSLMNTMANLDDANEEANLNAAGDFIFDEDAELTQVETNTTINGTRYDYQYSKSADSNYTYNTPEKYREYNYLLEFELHDRFDNEASWFYSARTKQAVVVKYPEFATQDEMLWIMSEYEAMEKAVYDNDFATYSGLIDVDSFAKVYLIQELALNLDSCATSYYIHNEFTNAEKTQSKLVAGPVWDYDWSFGSYAGNDSYKQKPIFNGSSTVTNGKSMANPNQMFVKVKALKTDNNQSASHGNNYNLQAKLAQNSSFWTECKKIWTNDMVDLLNKYVVNKYIDNDASGIIVDKWLPGIDSSVTMNKIRWSNARMAEDWGTKKTDDYTYGTHSFNYDDRSSSGSSSACYANTVYYLNDWIAARWNYMSGTGGLYDETLLETDEYSVTNVTFTATQNEAEITITPSATVTLNDEELSGADISFTVYVDGKADDTFTFADEATITLADGARSEVYIEVFPTAKQSVTGKSSAQTFEYNYVAESVEFTVKFKSSSSYRYIPTVTVNGTEYQMTKEGSAIAKNASGTQSYYWYEATVSVKEGESATLLFTNSLSMRATITIEAVANEEYYFGVDNLNNGTDAVNLTQYNTDDLKHILNFVKSATNMVTNDPEATGIATTSLDGTIYKMGDADEDNDVTILDATTAQLALAKKTSLSKTGTKLADYNLDGTNSITDATNIQTYLAQG